MVGYRRTASTQTGEPAGLRRMKPATTRTLSASHTDGRETALILSERNTIDQNIAQIHLRSAVCVSHFAPKRRIGDWPIEPQSC
jgi:hypothetical protein